MISALIIGFGLIAMAVGSFASEIYLAKKLSKESLSLNQRHH